MIAFVIGALVGLAVGAYAAYGVGWDRAIDHYAEEAISAAEARRARDRRGAWAPFVAVGAFVALMLVLGFVAR